MHRTLNRLLIASIMTIGLPLGLTATASAATAPATGSAITAPSAAAVHLAALQGYLYDGESIALQNVYSHACLDDYGFSLAAGDPVVQYHCDGYANQRWIVRYNPGFASFHLVNYYSGLCLDDYAFSREDGNAIVQWPCNGYANQQWEPVIVPGPVAYGIRNIYSQELLDDYGFSLADGNVIRQYHYDGYANQQWIMSDWATGQILVA